MKPVILLFSVSLLFFFFSVEAQPLPANLAKMSRGIGLEMSPASYKKVGIVVEGISYLGREMPVSENEIRNLAEARVTKAGMFPIEVNTHQPFLYLRITIVKSSYSVDASFSRSVSYHLEGTGQNYWTFAQVWQKGVVGTAAPRSIRAEVIDSLHDVLDRFISSYYAANQWK